MVSQIQNFQKIDEEALKKKAAKISIVEGSAYSMMDGFGLRYIVPYALALGMSNAFIGWLSSLPGLVGNLSQLYSSKLVGKYSRKKMIIGAVTLQSVMWAPLFAVGLFAVLFKMSLLFTSILLILFYTLLITFGAFAGPAWTSWMKDIVEKNSDSYFAKRNLIAGFVGLISTFIAGFLLDKLTKYHLLLGFGVLFSIALIGRGVSAFLFTKKYEPPYKKVEGSYFSIFQFIKKMRYNNFGRFVILLTVVNFAVAIASPFFVVYMLKNLGFSYLSYTLVVIISIIVNLISMPLWGKLGDKFGNIEVMKVSGIFIFLVPVLYLFIPLIGESYSLSVFIFILLIEAFSAFIWAGFNLSSGNFLYYAVTPQRIALCAAYNAVLTSIGAFLGATIGGLIASSEGTIFGMNPILFVFALSGALRLISIFIFLPRIKEVREVEKFGFEEVKKIIAPTWPKHLLESIWRRKIESQSQA